MKSKLLIIIVMLPFFWMDLDAQYFVGGSFSLNTTGNKFDNGVATSKSSNYSFNFSPGVGKFLSDNVAAGIYLNLDLSGSTTGTSPEVKSTTSTLGASPFVRYYALRWNKFSVFGQGNLGFSVSNSSVKANGIKSDGPKDTRFYFSVYPGLSYDIGDKLQLMTSINILSLGFSYNIDKNGTTETKTSGFNAGAGLSNIVSVGSISIGAIYKF